MSKFLSPLTRSGKQTWCHPGDHVGAVRQRVQAAGWDQCMVVNSDGIVLGLLHGTAWHADPEAAVELTMAAGPPTVRASHPQYGIPVIDIGYKLSFYAQEVLPKFR